MSDPVSPSTLATGDLPEWVEVYSTRTGQKLAAPVPRHYIGHPVLGRDLSLTPRQEATGAPARVTPPGLPSPAVMAGLTNGPTPGDDTTTINGPGEPGKEK